MIKSINNDNDKWKVLKDGELSDDKKSVTIVREFIDEDTYNSWKKKKTALPSIDDLVIEKKLKPLTRNIRTEVEGQ